MMHKPLELARYQREFAGYVRLPAKNPVPQGLDEARLQIYRELMFNNVSSIVQACFPISRQLLRPRSWQALMRRFFAQRRCTTPYFRELPQEFVDWLFEETRPPLRREPGFLPYLAHYEWLELAVDTHPDEPVPPPVQAWTGDVNDTALLEPSLRLACYPYPVHRIGVDHQTPAMTPTWLMVWRHEHEGVKFAEINQATFMVLQALQQQASTCLALAQRMSNDTQAPIQAQHIVDLIGSLLPMGVVRGAARP